MLKNEKSANRNDHQNRKTEVFCNKNRKTDLKSSQNRKTENPNAPLTKDWCVVTKRVYKADVAGSCVKNLLQPIMLAFWNTKEHGVAVVESRCYRKVNQVFGSISR